MKKLSVLMLSACLCTILLSQNQPVSNEMDNLQKQVSALKNNDFRQDTRLKQFIGTSTTNFEDLQISLDNINANLKTLNDSLNSSKMQIAMLSTDNQLLRAEASSIKRSNAFQYVLLLVILALLGTIFYLLSGRIRKQKTQIEETLSKTKEENDSILNKVRNDLNTEITALKEKVRENSELLKRRMEETPH